MTNYGSVKLISHYCVMITKIHAQHDHDYQEFIQNNEYQYAISLALIQIGELANRLTEDFKDYFPQVPWSQMRSFRNRLAHQYGSIDVDLTYNISTGAIIDIDRELTKIISDFETAYPDIESRNKNED